MSQRQETIGPVTPPYTFLYVLSQMAGRNALMAQVSGQFSVREMAASGAHAAGNFSSDVTMSMR